MILLKNFSIDLLNFSKLRTTNSGSKIIDFNFDILQTCWCKIIYDVDFSICTNVPESLKKILSEIDSKIIEHCSTVFKVCEQELTDMYKPLLKQTEKGCYFRIPISTKSVLWYKNEDDERKYTTEKKDFINLLKIGKEIRFIINLKKLTFKDNVLSISIELIQAELR